MTSNEIINIINQFSLSEKLYMVEKILKNIRKETTKVKQKKDDSIFDFAGILNEDEAGIFENAVKESRKIDKNEW